jgi:YidC/Oxa1 family membrane protein insertase
MLSSFRFHVLFPKQTIKEDAVKAQQQKTEQAKNAVKQTQATNINPNVTPGSIQTATLANNELKIEFNSLGGQVSKVELAKYKAYDHKTDNADLPLYLITKTTQLRFSV